MRSQELAVSWTGSTNSLQGAISDEQSERLRVLEGEIDRVARQTLARTLAMEPTAAGAQAAWQSVVKSCVLRAQAGARREVVSVQAMASEAPLGSLLGAANSEPSTFAMLTQLDNRATLEWSASAPPRSAMPSIPSTGHKTAGLAASEI